MFSPRQSASFMDSKMVSMVASACFCVMPRLATRMLIKSDLSIEVSSRTQTPVTRLRLKAYATTLHAGPHRTQANARFKCARLLQISRTRGDGNGGGGRGGRAK